MSENDIETQLKTHIRDVPDFPKPGIVFKDITTLLQNPDATRLLISEMAAPFRDAGVSAIVGIESRGFILGMPMAQTLNIGFVPVRKKGKLPADTYSVEYALEYGTDTLEIHQDALEPGQKVLIVDDLLATGGTAAATLELLTKVGADVLGATFAIELTFLNGREKLASCKTHSQIKY